MTRSSTASSRWRRTALRAGSASPAVRAWPPPPPGDRGSVLPRALSDVRRWRTGALVSLCLGLALLPLAVAAQPAFDLRYDLMSDLAARGAASAPLGQAGIAAIAAAHGCVALALGLRGLRVAAAGAVVAALGLLGVALVQITCPRGAGGCSGPESGRVSPRPLTDIVHRDLVVVLELGSLVLAVALAVHLWRRDRRRAACLATAFAALSVLFLMGQQRAGSIGWWQLPWLIVTCGSVVLSSWAAGPGVHAEGASRSRRSAPDGRAGTDIDRQQITGR